MKRKILSLVLCGCMVAGMFPAVALAEDSQSTDTATTATSGICGDELTWSYDEATKTVTISGAGDMYDYQTPEAQDANIGPWKDLDFNTLVVEEGVTSIGWDAFKNLPNLTSITLPKTLKVMESCFPFTGVTSVTIPEGVTSINNAFWGCTDLTSVTIPDTVTSIQAAFVDCSGLTSVDIPDRVTNINGAFQGCTGLTTVTIPSSVTSMLYAFAGCTNLTTANIPVSLTTIGEYSFADCTNLTTVNYAGTQEQWEAIEITGEGNDALLNATIRCGDDAEPPTSGSCGENLTWSYDEATKTVTISGTGDMYDYQTPEAQDANIGPWKDLDFNTLVVEEGVTSIGWDAFKNLPNLTSITLPKTLKVMESCFPFTGVTSVTIPEGVTSINNAFWGCTDLTSVTIPDTVTSIQAAFVDCSGLTSIDIPDSVTNINGAFQGCTGLTTVTIPSSVTSMLYAFAGCTNLTTVNIPVSLTTIGEYSFADCTNLTTVNYAGTQAQWEDIDIVEPGNDILNSVTVNYTETPVTPAPTPEPTPEPTQKPEPTPIPTPETQDKVEVTVSGDKAETTVGGVDIVLGNAGEVFEAGTVVTVEKVTQGAIYTTVEKALEKVVDKMENAAIFEFTATRDNAAVQPGGTLSVTFDIPKNLTATNLKMFYVSTDGKYEEVKITVDTKAGTVTANLTHFSTYVLANVAAADADAPQTGDNSALTVYVCVLAMAMAGLTMLLVNKRKD